MDVHDREAFEKFVLLGLDRLYISLRGNNENSYDQIKKSFLYHRFINNLALIIYEERNR